MQSRPGIYIFQQKYALDLLKNVVVMGDTTFIMPLNQIFKLLKWNEKLILDLTVYKKMREDQYT